MSSKAQFNSNPVQGYINEHSLRLTPLQEKLIKVKCMRKRLCLLCWYFAWKRLTENAYNELTHFQMTKDYPRSVMLSCADEVQLLQNLIRCINGKRCLDVGRFMCCPGAFVPCSKVLCRVFLTAGLLVHVTCTRFRFLALISKRKGQCFERWRAIKTNSDLPQSSRRWWWGGWWWWSVMVMVGRWWWWVKAKGGSCWSGSFIHLFSAWENGHVKRVGFTPTHGCRWTGVDSYWRAWIGRHHHTPSPFQTHHDPSLFVLWLTCITSTLPTTLVTATLREGMVVISLCSGDTVRMGACHPFLLSSRGPWCCEEVLMIL